MISLQFAYLAILSVLAHADSNADQAFLPKAPEVAPEDQLKQGFALLQSAVGDMLQALGKDSKSEKSSTSASSPSNVEALGTNSKSEKSSGSVSSDIEQAERSTSGASTPASSSSAIEQASSSASSSSTIEKASFSSDTDGSNAAVAGSADGTAYPVLNIGDTFPNIDTMNNLQIGFEKAGNTNSLLNYPGVDTMGALKIGFEKAKLEQEKSENAAQQVKLMEQAMVKQEFLKKQASIIIERERVLEDKERLEQQHALINQKYGVEMVRDGLLKRKATDLETLAGVTTERLAWATGSTQQSGSSSPLLVMQSGGASLGQGEAAQPSVGSASIEAVFTTVQLEGLRGQYDKYDNDRNGELSYIEVGTLISDVWQLPQTQTQREDIAFIMSTADSDQSGAFSWDEYLYLVRYVTVYLDDPTDWYQRISVMVPGGGGALAGPSLPPVKITMGVPSDPSPTGIMGNPSITYSAVADPPSMVSPGSGPRPVSTRSVTGYADEIAPYASQATLAASQKMDFIRSTTAGLPSLHMTAQMPAPAIHVAVPSPAPVPAAPAIHVAVPLPAPVPAAPAVHVAEPLPAEKKDWWAAGAWMQDEVKAKPHATEGGPVVPEGIMAAALSEATAADAATNARSADDFLSSGQDGSFVGHFS